MAVIAEYTLPSGCHVRIHDDDMDRSPGANERMWRGFWETVRESLRIQLDSGVPYEELEARIARSNEEGRRRHEELEAWRRAHPEYLWPHSQRQNEEEAAKCTCNAPDAATGT